MKRITSIVAIYLIIGCAQKKTLANPEKIKTEVFNAEADFNNLAASKGIAEAFYTFADDDAVIKRENDTLIKGKENIKMYYSQPKFQNASVTWKPDFVSVSEDGTQAYTYGKYIWTVKDFVGNKKDFKGVFHTVWKRQKDGNWKYVWD